MRGLRAEANGTDPGYYYQELGKMDKAQADFAKARELGYQN